MRVAEHRSSGLLLFALMVALPAMGYVSCSKACPEAGCLNQFAAVVSATSASLPAGTHRIDVTADGSLLSCTFEFPLSNGGPFSPQCSFGLIVFAGPALNCTEETNSAAKIQRCVPIPDQFQETIQVAGTPSLVTVEQSVGGAVIMQRSASPVYENNQPNGPGCEPICRQATVAWSIP